MTEYVCSRCGKEGREPHPCPYEEEINDNFNITYCTCCEECTQECIFDI